MLHSITLLLIFFQMLIPIVALSNSKIDNYLNNNFNKLNIPGLSVVLIRGKQTYFKQLGFADKNYHHKVTKTTLFEIGSCSKSFTALALLHLVHEKKIDLDDKVSKYYPWFFLCYKGEKIDVSIRQLIHHISGISQSTISIIPTSENGDAIVDLLKKLTGANLKERPGTKFIYATVNYDIIGAILEKVTGMPFKRYMESIFFPKMGLFSTKVGSYGVLKNKSDGFKLGFFSPHFFKAPIYRGNDPAGYILTNAEDIEKWLKIQLNLSNFINQSIIKLSHRPNYTVAPYKGDNSLYAFGWSVINASDKVIYHKGLNPNFSSMIIINLSKNIGVAVLANSNSPATVDLAYNLLKILSNEENLNEINSNNTFDLIFSISSLFLFLISTFLTYLLSQTILSIHRGTRKIIKFKILDIFKIILFGVLEFVCLFFTYKIPFFSMGVNWHTALVWSPISLSLVVFLLSLSFTLMVIFFILKTTFRHN